MSSILCSCSLLAGFGTQFWRCESLNATRWGCSLFMCQVKTSSVQIPYAVYLNKSSMMQNLTLLILGSSNSELNLWKDANRFMRYEGVFCESQLCDFYDFASYCFAGSSRCRLRHPDYVARIKRDFHNFSRIKIRIIQYIRQRLFRGS